MGTRHQLHYDQTASRAPRADILASTDLDVWFQPDFATPDLTVCLWKTGQPTTPHIYVASVYQEITVSTVSAALSKLVQYCNRHSKRLLLCCDTNSHSTLWNCDSSNKRGEDMEEFIPVSYTHLTLPTICSV